MKVKKIVSAFAVASVFAVSVFSYEATAKITFEGNIVEESKNKTEDSAKYEFFKLNALPETNKNGIEISFDGGIAGGSFDLFYKLDGSSKAEDGWAVSAKGTNIWFKPIDMLKVKFGYVGTDYFLCERVYNSKVGSPFALIQREAKDSTMKPLYATNADVDEMGFYIGLQPIEGLVISAAIAPGINQSGITAGEKVYASWGATAEYVFDNFIFEAAYRDNGNESWKIARVGVGYENDFIFAFVQPVVSFEYFTKSESYSVGGICADIYAEVMPVDALKFYVHAPVTYRLSGAEKDPSYMEYLVKAEYNFGSLGLLDDLTTYGLVESARAVTFDSNASKDFSMNAAIGTTFKVGVCETDLGVKLMVHGDNEESEKITWAIPFSVKVNL